VALYHDGGDDRPRASGRHWLAGALQQALCFGTRSDAFNLSAVAGRGTLAPRANVKFVPSRRKKPREGKDDGPELFLKPTAAG
jgi:hypothetical protein